MDHIHKKYYKAELLQVSIMLKFIRFHTSPREQSPHQIHAPSWAERRWEDHVNPFHLHRARRDAFRPHSDQHRGEVPRQIWTKYASSPCHQSLEAHAAVHYLHRPSREDVLEKGFQDGQIGPEKAEERLAKACPKPDVGG